MRPKQYERLWRSRSALGAALALWLVWVLCAGAFLAVSAAPGCKSLDKGLELPSVAWVKADRATFNVVAPKLRAYLEADQELEDDALARRTWLGLLGDWELRLETAEDAVGLSVDGGGKAAGS